MSSPGDRARSDGGTGDARAPEPAALDPYGELDVDPRADSTRIRRAYHAKARLLHPDLGGDPGAMARLNAAYEVLSDPARRRSHDATRPKTPRPRRDAAPHWTGAAGPPPGKPAGPVLDVGIFAGWSIGEVARHDPGYLDWLAERPEGRPYLAAIDRFLTPMRSAAGTRANGGRTPPAGERERSRWRR